MALFKKKNNILKKNYLDVVPFIKMPYNQDNGKVVILATKFKQPLLSKLLIPKSCSKNLHIRLDEFGSATWLLIDGFRNVQQICDLLTQQFGKAIQPVEERTTKFFSILHKYNYIGFKE